VALAWLLAQPTVSSVVVGVRTAAQLVDNLGAALLELRPDEIVALTEASQEPRHYPYRSANALTR
jgi:aryl-alcohol dehydrogenase-like predicted oxidoreductase